MRRILIVAHQTITGDELAETVASRMAEGPCEFTLLVPRTQARDLASKISALSIMSVGAELGKPARAPGQPIDPYLLARSQLNAGVAKLRDLGAIVSGEVGPAEPLEGIREITQRHQFDEVIVSTLPKRVSRWLHQDLPRRVERETKLPVTVVTAGGGR